MTLDLYQSFGIFPYGEFTESLLAIYIVK